MLPRRERERKTDVRIGSQRVWEGEESKSGERRRKRDRERKGDR